MIAGFTYILRHPIIRPLLTYVDDEYRGRVMSAYMMEMGMVSLGAFVAGALAEAIGAPTAVLLLGVALLLFVSSLLAFSPRMRNLN